MAAAALDGFRIVALPYARLGAAFHNGMATGKFQGVSSAATPTGNMPCHQQPVGACGRDGLAIRQQRGLRVVPQDRDAARNLAAGFGHWLADLADDEVRQVR